VTFEYQKSTHAIGEAIFKFVKLIPTVGEPDARKLVIESGNDRVEVTFTSDDFEIFKAIVREY
jgi:hypothetical protein